MNTEIVVSGQTSDDSRLKTQDSELIRSDEFDQTRQHIHMAASLCPVRDCPEWPTVERNGELPPRHVSPAIYEFQIEQLKEENRVLRERIVGFEQMNERLSNAVDEWLVNATSEHREAA